MNYPKGLWFNNPHPNAPDFVIGKISIKREDFIQWLQEQEVSEKGYVFLDVKQGRKNDTYVSLNEYNPSKYSVGEKTRENAKIELDEENIDLGKVPF